MKVRGQVVRRRLALPLRQLYRYSGLNVRKKQMAEGRLETIPIVPWVTHFGEVLVVAIAGGIIVGAAAGAIT